MKSDNEQVCCSLTLCHKDDAKPCRCHENNWSSNQTKPGNGKENLNRILCDSRGSEGDANHVADVQEDPDCVTAHTYSPAKGDSFEKDSVFYMDKSVMECDMPEIVVCFKENTYHVVKDICVDEGVPVEDKFLFDNSIGEKDSGKLTPNQCRTEDSIKVEEVNVDVLSMPVMETEKPKSRPLNNSTHEDEEQSASFMDSDSKDLLQKEEMKDDLRVKMSETDRFMADVSKSSAKDYADMLVVDASKSSTENDSDVAISVQRDSDDLMPREEMKNDAMDKTGKSVSIESLTLGDILSMEDNGKPSNRSSHESEEQSLESLSGNRSSGRPNPVSEGEDSNSSSQEVLSLEKKPDLVSAMEKPNNGTAEEKCSDNKDRNLANLSSVSISQESSEAPHDNSDTNSCTHSIVGKDDDSLKQDSDRQASKNNYVDEDSIDQIVSSQFHSSFGDTSFSAAGPVSGLITYSGPISYAGSLSVRSDSSTTSTRSFAFPILQSEWNSSPVRMAKADRRRLRRDKGWRQTLLCCRF